MSRSTQEKARQRGGRERQREAAMHGYTPAERIRLQNRARVLFAAGRMPEEIADMLEISVEECRELQRYSRDQIAFLLTDDGMRQALIDELTYQEEARRKWVPHALAPTRTADDVREAAKAHRIVMELFVQRREALSWGRDLRPLDEQLAQTGVSEQELEAMTELATEAERRAIQAGDERVMMRLLAEARKKLRGEEKERKKRR